MWQILLMELFIQLIKECGPVVIQLIIKWLMSLSGEVQQVACAAFGDAITKIATDNKTTA